MVFHAFPWCSSRFLSDFQLFEDMERAGSKAAGRNRSNSRAGCPKKACRSSFSLIFPSSLEARTHNLTPIFEEKYGVFDEKYGMFLQNIGVKQLLGRDFGHLSGHHEGEAAAQLGREQGVEGALLEPRQPQGEPLSKENDLQSA